MHIGETVFGRHSKRIKGVVCGVISLSGKFSAILGTYDGKVGNLVALSVSISIIRLLG